MPNKTPQKITVIGSMNMDLIVRAPHIPASGETIIGGAFSTAEGGKGANQAVAAARLGARVTMVGCVGDDAHGRHLLSALQADGISTDFVRVAGNSHTGVALITVSADGENSIVVSSGANHALSPTDVESAEAAIADADMLLLQLEIPLEVVATAVEIAHRHKIPVLLNPAPATQLSPTILDAVDYLIPNESETTLLTEHTITDIDSMRRAAKALRTMGVGTVILTLGSRGAFFLDEKSSMIVPAFPVDPVDTTAAGDAFIGAFAVARAQGESLENAMRFAAAAGAVAVTGFGAQASLPTLAAVKRMMKE